MSSVSFVEGLFGSLLAGLNAIGFLIVHKLNKRKFAAEVANLKATARRTEEETNDLVSARLIRELDRLTAANQTMASELERLRAQVVQYAAKEQIHAAENASLKIRIRELEADRIHPLGEILDHAFPVPLSHVSNEFDKED